MARGKGPAGGGAVEGSGTGTSGAQLAMLGVVLALVLVLNDRAPDFVRYTLILALIYLLLVNVQQLPRLSDQLVGSLSSAARGTGT